MSKSIDNYELQQQRREARFLKYKTALLKLLRAARVAVVVIEYDGEGDGGQIESVSLHDAIGARLPDKPLSVSAQQAFSELHLFKQTLHGALEAFAWELLSIHHDGFENNDGAYGTITVDVDKQIAEIEHNARQMGVFTSTQEV